MIPKWSHNIHFIPEGKLKKIRYHLYWSLGLANIYWGQFNFCFLFETSNPPQLHTGAICPGDYELKINKKPSFFNRAAVRVAVCAIPTINYSAGIHLISDVLFRNILELERGSSSLLFYWNNRASLHYFRELCSRNVAFDSCGCLLFGIIEEWHYHYDSD